MSKGTICKNISGLFSSGHGYPQECALAALPSASATDCPRRLVIVKAPPQRLQGAPDLQKESQTSIASHPGLLLHGLNEESEALENT